MCMMGGYPDPGGAVIASLKKGDIISVGKGGGMPPAPFARVLTVYEVHDLSALCTDGTMLSCFDGGFVIKTGETDPNPSPNLKARWILTQRALTPATEWTCGVARRISTEWWYLKYRIGKWLDG